MFRSANLLVGCAIALVAVPPAHAQTAADAPAVQEDSCDLCDVDPVATRLPVVVTAARAEQRPWEIGQALAVVTRADLDRRQTVAVADLLATTPGVTVTRNGSTGGFTGVRLRGAEAEQTLVVIDGIRVNDPSSPGGGFDFANLFAASVERIEVLRGPDSVPWGSQAIGGVVNIVTITPTDRFTARAQAEYGYRDQLYTTAGVSGGVGPVTGALSGGYLRTDGISAAADGVERDGFRQYGGSGRLGIALSDEIGIDLRGWYAASRARLDGFPPPAYALADTGDYSTTRELYGYAGIHGTVAGVRNTVAFTIADIDRDNYDPSAGVAPSFLGRGRSERYEYQGDARLLDQLRIVGGLERENTRFNDGFIFAKTGVTSVYGQAIVKPVRQLTVTGGARYDDHDAFGGHTTLGADAALRLGGTTLRASYGEGFKAPTLFQLYSDYGNGRLDPETARGFDLGVQQSVLDGRATLGATYFRRATRHQIDLRSCTRAEQTTAGSICVARPFGVYDNIARARAEGIELELALRPVDALTLSANFSHIDAVNRSPGINLGRDLARRPRDTASVDADYRFPFGVSVGGTVTIVGDSFDDAADSVRLDGYALATIRAALPVSERIELYGRIENVADERYQTVAGYGTYGRAAYGGIRVKLD